MSKPNRNDQATEDFLQGSVPLAPPTAVVRKAINDVVNPKRRLSFFQRQEAIALGKSLDAHGNINLNEAANQATQGSGSIRVNPNVKASRSDPLSQSDFVSQTSKCHQHCQKTYGRSNCPYCQGIGYGAIEEVGGNQARTLFPGQ